MIMLICPHLFGKTYDSDADLVGVCKPAVPVGLRTYKSSSHSMAGSPKPPVQHETIVLVMVMAEKIWVRILVQV